MNSLKPRLARHLRTSRGEGRVIKWHIDYLLSHPAVKIEDIYAVEGAAKECEIAAKVAEMGEPVPRFGSSDCRCRSHLYRVEDCRFLEKMGLKKRDIGRLLTSSPVQL
jgi:Uri superfamily endonuclease